MYDGFALAARLTPSGEGVVAMTEAILFLEVLLFAAMLLMAKRSR